MIRPASDENALPERHGQVRRVLRADLSQEYLLYLPSARAPDAPLLVSAHDVSRNVDEHVKLLAAYCETHGTVLVVPHFSVEHHRDYQRLGRVGRGKRADVALNMIVEEAAASTGVSAERFFLFGYAGGAQFAHRYAMAHPHRVAGAVLASAGRYTPPDPTRRFPRGTRASARLPGVSFDPEEFLRVPMTVIADANSGAAKRPRRRGRPSEEQEQEQGRTRAERARDWVAAMQAAAKAHGLEPAITYEEFADCEHSFLRAMLRSGLGERLFEAITAPNRPASPRS